MYYDDPAPRDPSVYDWTDHFRDDIFDDPMRYLSKDMVDTIIRDGNDYPKQGGPGNIRRRYEFSGVYGVLVLDLEKNVIVTGWTEVASTADALASGEWTLDQLKVIRAFERREHKRPTTPSTGGSIQ